MPASTSGIDLPAWCNETPRISAEPEDQDNAPLSEAKTEPVRRLRHTCNRRERRADGGDGGASPDLEGGIETRSFVVDPFLYPTPANRVPLRQYVSAPELSSQAAHEQSGNGEGGLASSSSMDALFHEMGWGPATTTTSHQVPQSSWAGEETSGTSSRASFGGQPPMTQVPLFPSTQSADIEGGRQLEIDGSLYRRRANAKGDEMPLPSPIQTTVASQNTAEDTIRRPSRSATVSGAFGATFNSSLSHGPHTAHGFGERMQEEQRGAPDMAFIQDHYAALPQGAFGIPLLQDFVAPAQQHAGQASSERTARAVQAALLFGSDAPERRNSLEGMSAFDYPSSSTNQPAPYNHYLLYSSVPGPSSAAAGGPPTVGYTSACPSTSDVHSGSSLTGGQPLARRRKSSMPAPNQAPTQHSFDIQGGNSLQLEGLGGYAMRPQPTVTQGHVSTSSMGSYSVPQHPVTVPLMPVYLPPTSVPGSATSESWHLPASSTAPSSGLDSARSLQSFPPSSSSGLTSYEPLPQTPRHPQPMATPPSAKKAKSTPNLRHSPGAYHAANRDTTPTPSPGRNSPEGSARKIAGNRRVQSSNNLRRKKSSPEALGAAPPLPPLPAGGFSFVNYGVEDAQELCAAVAPSGSYKIPLKGYGGPGGSGGSSSSISAGSSSPLGSGGLPHKAPSAAIKSKPRPRAPVDNSRWIEETGEDDDEGDDDNEDDFNEWDMNENAGSASKRRRKSEAGAFLGGRAKQQPRPRKKSAV